MLGMVSCWCLPLTIGRGEREERGGGGAEGPRAKQLDFTLLASSAVSTRWASSSRRSSGSRTEMTSPLYWLGTRQIWRHSARSGTLPPYAPGGLRLSLGGTPCLPSHQHPASSIVLQLARCVAPESDLLSPPHCPQAFPAQEAGWKENSISASRSHRDPCLRSLPFPPPAHLPLGAPPLLPALRGSELPPGNRKPDSSPWHWRPTVVSSLPFSALTTSPHSHRLWDSRTEHILRRKALGISSPGRLAQASA